MTTLSYRTTPLFRGLLLGAACFVAALTARAQITFTYTGTSATNLAGYTIGQPVTFTFTLAPDAAPSASYYSGKIPMLLHWSQTGLFSSVTGTGIVGDTTDVRGELEVLNDGSGNNRLTTSLYPYTGAGLTVNGLVLSQIRFEGIGWTGLSVPVVGAAVSDPHDYLNANIAPATYTFNNSSGAAVYLASPTINEAISVNLTSVTISGMSAIPEPSTYAAIFGALALGAVAVVRRRRTTALAQN